MTLLDDYALVKNPIIVHWEVVHPSKVKICVLSKVIPCKTDFFLYIPTYLIKIINKNAFCEKYQNLALSQYYETSESF